MSDPADVPSLKFFRATIAYDGSAYSGWQWQPDRLTIQAELERALRTITQREVRVLGSGRTDAGVHAIGQVVSFVATTRLDAATLKRAMNANLPRDICVRELARAEDGFHAIRDTVRKRYRYVIQDGRLPDVFARQYAWFVPHHLNVERMKEAAGWLLGEHDFSAYETTGSKRVTAVRTVFDLRVERRDSEFAQPSTGEDPLHWSQVWIEVEANGFLYNMVRNIAGSLVQVGRGEQAPEWTQEVLLSGDRRRAGPTAPPHGLFLLKVWYQ